MADTERWTQALAAYRKRLAAVRSRLPQSVALFEKCSMHDDVIIGLERPAKDAVILHTDRYDVTFHGVSEFQCEGAPENDVWLYDEIDLSERGKAELRVLLEQGELHITFESLCVFDVHARNWRIPPSAPLAKKKR